MFIVDAYNIRVHAFLKVESRDVYEAAYDGRGKMEIRHYSEAKGCK